MKTGIVFMLAMTIIALLLSVPVISQDLPLVTPVPTNADAVELVANGGFEVKGNWTLSKGDGRFVCPDSCEYRFTAIAGGSRLLQKILIDGAVNDRLVMSFFSRGKNWKHSSFVHLKIFYTDGTSGGMYTGLNHAETMIRNESQIVATKPYSKLKITIAAGSLTGRLWVDDVSVTLNTP